MLGIHRSSLLFWILAGTLSSIPATHAQLAAFTGDVEPILPPASVVSGALEDDQLTRVFTERSAFVLASDVAAGITEPGDYPPGTSSPGFLAAGTSVNVYLLHFDTVGGNLRTSDGAVTFAGEILGLILESGALDASDSLLGGSTTAYPAPGSEVFRGVEIAANRDTLSLSPDRRTLSFHFGGSTASDQIRVLTAVPQSPSGPIVGTFGAVEPIAPPASVVLGDLESNDRIRVFTETDGAAGLPIDFTVEITDPGTYPPQVTSAAILAAGTAVHSTLLHFDPVGGNLSRQTGGVVFGSPVLAIATSPTSLDDSDSIGPATTAYPPAGAEVERGAELTPGRDWISLSQDRRVVTVHFGAQLASDQIRVFTAPQPLAIVAEAVLTLPIGLPVAHPFQAVGGVPPYSWTVLTGSVPAGLNLGADGVLRGTATVAGAFELRLQVTDGAGAEAQGDFQITTAVTRSAPPLRIEKFGILAVPGRTLEYFVMVKNVSLGEIKDVEVAVFLEKRFDFVLADPEEESAVDKTIIWDLPEIDPGEVKIFVYEATLDIATPVGITVRGNACVAPADLIVDQIACRDLCRQECALDDACESLCLADVCQEELRLGSGLFAADCTLYASQTFAPFDPNEKGTIAELFIQPDQTLVYPIHFENIGNAEAKDVFITDVLETDLDASTVEILSPGGGLDVPTRTVRWDLLDIDLAPGATDHVLLQIEPEAASPSGTEIRNHASIQFEGLEPIITDDVLNIIDTTPPVCVVDPLPAISEPDFQVSWTATDEIGEVDSTTLFVSVDGGPFTPVLDTTLVTSTTYSGDIGHTYGFLCIATDTARNVEIQAPLAEATTEVPANQPPEAVCIDVTVTADADLCTAEASVDGGSSDPDGDPITLEQSPPGPYHLGATAVTLTVTDDEDATDFCQATVTVTDGTAPEISSATATPSVLWPPNHEMIEVTVDATASDACGGPVSCQITAVSSNEPPDGSGDGHHSPDWEITGDLTVRLRAERSGLGDGRIYSLYVTCSDGSGNSAGTTVTVTVPHDNG